ncbi:hypothetical protein ACB316_16145 [Aeromonas sanarellii]
MRLSNEQREQVIALRRSHSLNEVASLAGLPLGTVKAIISRSGLFTDNPRHRAMFTLPARENSGETLPAGLASIGFANLDGLAEQSITRRAREAEAIGRFGDALWNDTQAEAFCLEALRGLELVKCEYPPVLVAERFKTLPELMPHTLSDCLHELAYWDDLYRLRRACDANGYYESSMETWAREAFVFGLLAELRPRSREEARETLRYLMGSERKGWPEADRIFDNLIG